MGFSQAGTRVLWALGLALSVLLTVALPASAEEPTEDPGGDPPAALAPAVVASVNLYQRNSPEARRADIVAAVSRPEVAIVGWQEAGGSHQLLQDTLLERGWETYLPPGANEVPISWDAQRFELLDAATELMHGGVSTRRVHFPARYLTRVDLRDLASGVTWSTYNTHVNQHIERVNARATTGKPNRSVFWEYAVKHLARLRSSVLRSESDMVVVTGDFNVNAAADLRVRHRAFPTARYAGVLTSNWSRLGLSGSPTFREPSGKRPRYIDYVWQRTGAAPARMLSHHSVAGRSDHRQLFVRFGPG